MITDNARVFKNLPVHIPCKEPLTLRGEAVIRYSDFEKINVELEAEAAASGNLADVRYKNPRNLCSGSVRQLNNRITAKRRVRFYAFSLVKAGDLDFDNSREKQMEFLRGQGFETVESVRVNSSNVAKEVDEFEKRIADNDLPSDGLVLTFDDIAYGESLGTTAKFPRNSIAFKWADEIQETTLTDVECMIIPQIAENLTGSGTLVIPSKCPVCGQDTRIRRDNDTEVLICTNPDCAAKKIKAFSLFVSRSAMNIDGLSEMTLEKLIAAGLIHNFADIYHLDAHRDVIGNMDGFGKKSCDKLLEAVEKSRETTLSRVLCAAGIPGVGISGARVLCSNFHDDIDEIRKADRETLSSVEGIGPVLAENIAGYFEDERTASAFDALLAELHLHRENTQDVQQILAGKTFVITGKVNHFANRDELKAKILSLGGKAAGSVSAKTDYLINNDVTSSSSKNKKARELGIPILSEEEFLAMISGA